MGEGNLENGTQRVGARLKAEDTHIAGDLFRERTGLLAALALLLHEDGAPGGTVVGELDFVGSCKRGLPLNYDAGLLARLAEVHLHPVGLAG